MTIFQKWRDISAYPTEQSYREKYRLKDDRLYTSKAWAWQFLRRNPAYQDDFLRLRIDSSNRLGIEVAKKYGLTMMLSYTEEDPDLIPFKTTLGLYQFGMQDMQRKAPKLNESELAIVFDLKLPIREQLASAKAQISEEIQRLQIIPAPKKRKRTSEFIRYLRIIDAKASKASNRQIAEQFVKERIYRTKDRNGDKYYIGQSLVEQDWHVAKKIMEIDYIAVAYS